MSTILEFPLQPPPKNRYCAICQTRLPLDAPPRHRVCLNCWRWTRLGAALKSARRWMETRP